jgi:hypothetical protein
LLRAMLRCRRLRARLGLWTGRRTFHELLPLHLLSADLQRQG